MRAIAMKQARGCTARAYHLAGFHDSLREWRELVYFKEALSMTKRYFTSLFNRRS